MKGLREEVMTITGLVSEFISQERLGFDQSAVETKKSASDLVSYVDKEAERMLVEKLGNLDDSFGFIAEEGTGMEADDWNWIIDPLDGTTNFIHGLPVYSISVALRNKEGLQLAVIEDIVQRDTYSAEKGRGAWCNDKQISVSPTSKLQDTLIATGFPYYDFDELDRYMKVLRIFMEKTRGVRRMGSAAIDLAYTASGKFDGFFEYNLNSWDVAAGILLVQEAGGMATEFDGGPDPLFGRSILAGNAKIYEEMKKVLKAHF